MRVIKNALGDFLRTARAQVQPADVGLPDVGSRRVPGLRREEVAVLAGMNSDYYARLEQGRESRPSPQILDALCRALRLDDAARTYLHAVSGSVPVVQRDRTVEAIDPSLRRLLESYTDTPAFVLNPALDLLMINGIGRALFSPFEHTDNLAYMTFLDDAAAHFFRDHHVSAASVVGNLRHATGVDSKYDRLTEVIDTLTNRSAVFRELWGAPTVGVKTCGDKALAHPDVGLLSLQYHTFDVRGAFGQQLVVYHAPPASRTADGLRMLGALHAELRPTD